MNSQYRFAWHAAAWYFGAYFITAAFAWQTFTWRALILCLVLHVVSGAGITLGAHRYFSHKTFVAPRWFHRMLGIAYLISFDRAGQGIISWVVQHHAHHRVADEPGDPHSPRDGFWWAFCGHHLWRNRTHWDQNRYKYSAPMWLWKDKFIEFIDRQEVVWLFQLWFMVLVACWGRFRGGHELAVSFLVWGIFVRFAITQTLHSCLDTLNHGRPWPLSLIPDRYETGTDAKNQFVLWPFQLGNECWHNFHHAYPKAANNGGSLLRIWRWDADSLVMKGLESTGVIKGCQWRDSDGSLHNS